MLNVAVVSSLSGHYSASWPTKTHDPHSSRCEQSSLATRYEQTSTGLVSGVDVLVHNFHEPNEQSVLEDANWDTLPVPGVLKPPRLPRSTTTDPGGWVRTRRKSWSKRATLEKLKYNLLLLKSERARRHTPTWPGSHQRETKSSWGKQRVLSEVFKGRLSLIYSSLCQKPVVKMGQPVILKMGN